MGDWPCKMHNPILHCLHFKLNREQTNNIIQTNEKKKSQFSNTPIFFLHKIKKEKKINENDLTKANNHVDD